MRLSLASLLLTMALAINATQADSMRRAEAPARADRDPAGSAPNATLALPDGLSDDKPAADGPATAKVGEKGMVVGYAICGLALLGGYIMMKAVSHSAKKASDNAVEGVFGPLTSPNGAD